MNNIYKLNSNVIKYNKGEQIYIVFISINPEY